MDSEKVIEKYIETRKVLFDRAGISPRSMYTVTDGPVRNVHYLELGEGKPLILIHGGLSHSSEWINIMKPLSKKFHLYVVDRPGHGLTDPIDYTGKDYRKSAIEFILSFMEAKELETAHIMANSMGGYFATSFAMKYPEKVEKLLLIGASAGFNYYIPLVLRIMGINGLNRIVATIAGPTPSAARMIHEKILVYHANRLPEEYYLHSYYNMLLPGAEKAHRTMLESVLTIKGWKKKLYLGDSLEELKLPVCFIWGEKDAFESPNTGRKKVTKIQNYRFETVGEAGHCPWLDQPEICVSLVIAMLED